MFRDYNRAFALKRQRIKTNFTNMLPIPTNFRNYQPPKPKPWYKRAWDDFCDFLPLVVTFGAVVALVVFIYCMIPNCPYCNAKIHPMDVYCSECGQQLRTTK